MDLSRGRPSFSSFIRNFWTGRILLVNAIVFILMGIESGSILMPSSEVIISFGAKDSMRLISGEWWRLITPVFVHIGLIHFLFNSYAIYILGLQLEPVIGAKYLIPIYFVAGFCGNVASALFTVGISAGASSAIFGMLGCGWVIEKAIGRHVKAHTGHKPARGMYTSLVFVNLVLGFMIPAIDNAAHIGGLLAGIFLTYAILFIMPNRLQKRHVARGVAVIALVFVVSGAGAYFSCSSDFASHRFEDIADNAADYPEAAIVFYSRAIYAEPTRIPLYLKRARILVNADELDLAADDLKKVLSDAKHSFSVYDYLKELKDNGKSSQALELEDKLNIRSI